MKTRMIAVPMPKYVGNIEASPSLFTTTNLFEVFCSDLIAQTSCPFDRRIQGDDADPQPYTFGYTNSQSLGCVFCPISAVSKFALLSISFSYSYIWW